MRQVRMEAGRRISFLIAEKSMRKRIIGDLAGAVGGIPVSRAQDLTKQGKGVVYLEDRRQPLRLSGKATEFTKSLQIGSSIVLPGDAAGSSEVIAIESDTLVILKTEFKTLKALELLTAEEGTSYKIAPKVDQSAVYNKVFEQLDKGHCIGIFPEGGSHDRTELLPLKAGVAIMALGALVKNPDCDLKIVPCGMNYFHAHKFRSRAVIEFGSPLEVPKELVSMYAAAETKRAATKQLLDMIYDALAAVTVQVQDYETLMVIQAGRRLYKPAHKKLPLQSIVELNRRFIAGYKEFKDDPRVIKLKDDVMAYNRDLSLMDVKDHQLTNIKLSWFQVLGLLIYRSLKLALLALGSLPGLWLFAPIFIWGKYISKKKAREALAESRVKVQARDVLATWKLLVAMVGAPLLYLFYVIIGTHVVHRYELGTVSLREKWYGSIVPLLIMIILPMVTYSALRFGEVGMDIYKSLRPLRLAIRNSSILDELQDRREALAVELTNLINTLGPQIFPDLESNRVIAMPEYMTEATVVRRRRSSSVGSEKGPDGLSLTNALTPSSSGAISPASDAPMSSNPFFSTAPPSRRSQSVAHSRRPSQSATPITMFAVEESTASLGIVSEKLKEEMNTRMRRRKAEHLQRKQDRSSMNLTSMNGTESLP